MESQQYWILAINAALTAQWHHLEKGARAKRTTDKVNRKLPSRTKLGIVAVEQQTRSDQCHFLPRQEEHTRFQESNQSSINGFFAKKRLHPAAIVSLFKSNKRLRKPDWGNMIPVRENVPEAAQVACYWLSNWTQSPVGLLPKAKGKTTLWSFQSPCRGLAVLTHGNQKDPCLYKLYIIGFAIIY
jgi:hypothetical protein